ncbi:MAG: DinB family protein [Pyrinomonadaceae bacterium]|nr:DinB family protein [Phycisphaerales bacterium]
MNASSIIDRLERMTTVLPSLVAGLPDADVKFKPPSLAWSILEVVNHLVDEEMLDFRARLRLTLEDPSTHWPPIDPEGWAVEKNYNEQDLAGSLVRFVNERAASVRWLRSLEFADWNLTYQHPRIGPIPAGVILASWQAHDALHIRQIAKRIFELASRDAPEFSTRYAGEWGA